MAGGGGEAEEMSALVKAFSLLPVPPDVLRHLTSIGVCVRCLLRLFGCQEHLYSCPILTTATLQCVIQELQESSVESNKNGFRFADEIPDTSQEAQKGQELCCICLGILQFCHNIGEDLDKSFKERTLSNFIEEAAGLIKKEGHQIDDFSMEISVPAVILANERFVWVQLKAKYGSQDWFMENFRKQSISVKDALKWSMTIPLQRCLDAKMGNSPFRIRFTYNHHIACEKLQDLLPTDSYFKKRKLDTEHHNGAEVSFVGSRKEYCQHPKIESDTMILKALEGLDDHRFSECYILPQHKFDKPCDLSISCCRMPMYIGGRYLKFSRKVSQSRWIIEDERMGEASVEEIIGLNALAVCKGDSYKFHAAGREDIDVRMLGSGRPFLVEISNARLMPHSIDVQEIANVIDQCKDKYVSVRNLKILGSEAWELMREGEAEKQKQYAALVWTSRPFTEHDIEKISMIKNLDILQKTPIRVLHRRSPLERNRIIHWMRPEKVGESSNYLLLHLCTQAGTYIKEFVHGDLGRTYPSLGSILGCRTEILQLDVTDVKMDNFL